MPSQSFRIPTNPIKHDRRHCSSAAVVVVGHIIFFRIRWLRKFKLFRAQNETWVGIIHKSIPMAWIGPLWHAEKKVKYSCNVVWSKIQKVVEGDVLRSRNVFLSHVQRRSNADIYLCHAQIAFIQIQKYYNKINRTYFYSR